MVKNLFSLVVFFVGAFALCTTIFAQTTFTDVTSTAGLVNGGNGHGVAFNDYDNDGDLDIYQKNHGEETVLYRNNGDGTFSDVTSIAGVGFMGDGGAPAFGDYDNDGDLDIYVSNYGANVLYRNNGDGTFTDVTSVAGVGDMGWGNTVVFGDYDNDGDLDIYVAIEDEPNILYRNDGDGTFTDVASDAGVGDTGHANGCAAGDYDNDGDLDIYVAYEATLYRNNGNANNWLIIKTVGTVSNRDGIGARVRVVSGAVSQIREVSGGSGFCSQNSLPIEFGLGTYTKADSVIVRWPSGIVQILRDVPANTTLEIVEPLVPNIGLSEISQDFGEVLVASSVDWVLKISNVGWADLTVSTITSDNTDFSVTSPTFPQTISPNTSIDVTVTFAPSIADTIKGNLIVISDDPDKEQLTISLSGVGIAPDINLWAISYDYGNIDYGSSAGWVLTV